MKILYVLNDTLHHAGTESVILNYYNHIDRNEFQIDFLLNASKSETEDNDICRYLISKGSKVYCITPRRVDSKANKEEFLSVINENGYDIVHTHTDAVGAYFLKLAKEAGVKVRIAHSHNTRHQLEKKSIKSRIHFSYLEMCRKNIRKEATHYMACSREAGEWLFGEKNFSDGKVFILNNAIDIDEYKFDSEKRESLRNTLKERINEDVLLIGHIGRFVPQKNHSFLLEVFKKISEKKSNVGLLLVGAGPLEEELKNKARELGIEDKVIFFGVTDDVQSALSAMDVFVFPSLYEGLSVVMIEAQCNGLKCFMSDVKEVSVDTMLTDRTERIKPEAAYEWAERILNADLSRKDETDNVRAQGFDIKTEAVRLGEYYTSLLRDCV